MSAIAFTTIFDNPIDFVNDVCGEIVYFSGVIRTLFHVTQSNNQTLIKMQGKPEGITGTGSNGVIYQAVGATQTIARFDNNSFPIDGTFVNNFRLISQGSTDNFQLHETLRVTINDNGDMTIIVENIRFECNG